MTSAGITLGWRHKKPSTYGPSFRPPTALSLSLVNLLGGWLEANLFFHTWRVYILSVRVSHGIVNEIQVAEVCAFYGFQTMMENIHSQTYSLLIDAYIKDTIQREYLFDGVKTDYWTEFFDCESHWHAILMCQCTEFVANRLLVQVAEVRCFYSNSTGPNLWWKHIHSEMYSAYPPLLNINFGYRMLFRVFLFLPRQLMPMQICRTQLIAYALHETTSICHVCSTHSPSKAQALNARSSGHRLFISAFKISSRLPEDIERFCACNKIKR